MPILQTSPTQDAIIEDFRGPWLRPNPTDVPASEALLSLNTEYNPHSVDTRFGFDKLWLPGKLLPTLLNIVKAPDTISASGEYILIYNQTDGIVQLIPDVTTFTPYLHPLYSVTAKGITLASEGNQLITASYNQQGTQGLPLPVGAGQAHVTGIFLFEVDTETAFLQPLSTKPLLANVINELPGIVTPGVHSVGYIITSTNGFLGRPSPVDTTSGLFDTTSNIAAPGGQNIAFQITANWPQGAEGIQIVMSPVTNPFQYFIVPGLNFAVPGGSSFTVNCVINISDAQLIATGTDVTNNQYLLTQTPDTGGGPFNPFKVIAYGPRICYLTYDSIGVPAVYISDINNYQHITELFNKLYLPEKKVTTTAFVLRGILYVLGPTATYGFQDTGLQPVDWPSPALIDGSIGSACINGTVVNAANDWAAVVSQTGLYIFNGQYQERPLTYMIDQDWRRINWVGAQNIQILDNKDKKELIVIVPLDGATIPSHMMCFDYTDGLDYQSVKYTLWNIPGVSPLGACIFQNPTTAFLEVVISANSTAQSVLRQMNETSDPHPYQDYQSETGGVVTYQTIPFTWECAPQPDGSIGQIMSHVGGYVRANGSGTLNATAYGIDRVRAVPWSRPISLALAPGVEYFRQFYVNSERCSVRFTCGQAPGDFVSLSGYRHRFYPWALRR